MLSAKLSALVKSPAGTSLTSSYPLADIIELITMPDVFSSKKVFIPERAPSQNSNIF